MNIEHSDAIEIPFEMTVTGFLNKEIRLMKESKRRISTFYRNGIKSMDLRFSKLTDEEIFNELTKFQTNLELLAKKNQFTVHISLKNDKVCLELRNQIEEKPKDIDEILLELLKASAQSRQEDHVTRISAKDIMHYLQQHDAAGLGSLDENTVRSLIQIRIKYSLFENCGFSAAIKRDNMVADQWYVELTEKITS